MKDKSLTDINELWEYACSGNIEKLKEYYENGGSVNNRYSKFGVGHSLIMGHFAIINLKLWSILCQRERGCLRKKLLK